MGGLGGKEWPHSPARADKNVRPTKNEERPQRSEVLGSLVCLLCESGSSPWALAPTAELPGAAACSAGFSPDGSCYCSPHVQSELVTDHLHFRRANGQG